jgi:polar amino acid transport system permease protein
MGISSKGKDLLMFAHLLAELPRFFSLNNIAFLAQALAMTLTLTFVGCISGFVLAFILVVARMSRGWWTIPLRVLAIAYVELFRRIPFLVITYLVLFSLAVFVKGASLFIVAITAICIYSTAYSAEIIRGGFESVSRQQIEAAAAMNFSRWRTLVHIIMPQALPVILPPAIAFAVGFIKDTALVGQIGVFELAFRGRELNNQGYSGLLVFGTIALLYFFVSYPLSFFGKWLENRVAASRNKRPKRQLWLIPGP